MRLAANLRSAILDAAMTGKLTEHLDSELSWSKTLIETSDRWEEVLPSNWCSAPISSISVSMSAGKSPDCIKEPATSIDEWGVLTTTAVQENRFLQRENKKLPASFSVDPKWVVNRGDVLITRAGPMSRTGVACVVDSIDYNLILSDKIIRIEGVLINPFYLAMAINSPLVRNSIFPLMNGMDKQQVNLSQKLISTIVIPIPPMEEQQRIVDRVNELMPAISEYEQMENRLVSLKESFPGNLRDAVLQAAVLGQLTERVAGEDSSLLVYTILKTKKRLLSEKAIIRDNSCKTQPIDPADNDLPEIPSNWTWVRLGSLCSKIGAGSTPAGGSKVYVKSGIKFLREQNIHNAGLVMDGLVFITDEINTSMKGSQVQAKDILVNITGASIGRNALVPDDFDIANVNQHVLIVRLIDDRLRHYIHLCLQSPHIFNQMMDKQMGDKPGLSATKVANFLIPLPPIEEQQRIVDRLNTILPMCDALTDDI